MQKDDKDATSKISSSKSPPAAIRQQHLIASPLPPMNLQSSSAAAVRPTLLSPLASVVTGSSATSNVSHFIVTSSVGPGQHSLIQATSQPTVVRQLTSQGIIQLPVSPAGRSFISVVGTQQSPLSVGPGTILLQELQNPTSQYTAPQNTIVSASGGTIHHHGQSPSRMPPLVNQVINQPIRLPSANNTSPGSSRSSIGIMSTSPKSPRIPGLQGTARKRLSDNETSEMEPDSKKLALETKIKDLRALKEKYNNYLVELFFLQNGGNMMDYYAWKKRPTAQLIQFLRNSALDSDEDDFGIQINDEVRIISTNGTTTPMVTPVAISTTLPQAITAISQMHDPKKIGGRHGMVFGPHQPTQPQQIPQLPGGIPVVASPTQPAVTTVHSSFTPISSSQVSSTPSLCTSSHATSAIENTALGKSLIEPSSSGHSSHQKTGSSPQKLKLPSPSQRSHTRQHAISAVYDSGSNSQEAMVEKAKQEANIIQKINELRREGIWSSKRLPKVQEPSRNKAHWDYLLEEMQWLAADFAQERKWKKAGCRKIARMVTKYHQELAAKELRAEKEEGQKLKRIASQMSKMVKEFWSNIEKVVQYKQTSRLDEKRKRAMDMHLNFIVDQTEKYSSWLTAGLTSAGSAGSVTSTTPSVSNIDGEFEPSAGSTDDEETIEKEEREAKITEEQTRDEVAALQREMEMPIEDLLQSLPPEVLEKPASPVKSEKSDEEFSASESGSDDEETLEEQEKHETKDKATIKKEQAAELKDLEAEKDMTVEELLERYRGAYDDDFEFDQGTPSGSEEEDESDDEAEEEEEEDSDDEEEMISDADDVGVEYLMKEEVKDEKDDMTLEEATGPSKELTDIAAAAQSLQPTGYTLETTKVNTPVPFLIKHSLREYQHVGLDWLATLYEKKLNGILADEMGLGKTIQTIALLAHLACDKGIWGPHLIVVPTSVMLNWEMELKKWAPAFKILTYYGSQKERKLKRTGWTKTNAFHVCITSYKLVIQDCSSFRRKKWRYLILDEAQNIKNFKSQRWQTLLNFNSQRRLLLTGTPLQNSLMELWSLMHFLMPHVFASHKDFKEWFSNPLTGMVEGSQEYNESLIRRLHKVLRPFLLRRLKADVEKQMPKKYEHVVMCRLSKRQRFLYDDFMSQTKTQETLAGGHFMSVINVLMQLRKVCNHPNLFDPRPTVSPFQTEGITYQTASLVLKALEYDPFNNVDFFSLHPNITDLELRLPAFVAHRIKRLQTSKPLIMEIDSQPDPPPRPKPVSLKSFLMSRNSSVNQSAAGRSSPFPIQPQVKPTIQPSVSTPIIQPTTPIAAAIRPVTSLVYPTAINTTQPEQLPGYVAPPPAKIIAQPPGLTFLQNNIGPPQVPSQPITVQIHHTQQGTRLMIPSGQLAQLPGFIQILQTSSGQQIIASPQLQQSHILQTGTATVLQNLGTPTVVPPVSSAASQVTVVNGLSPAAAMTIASSPFTSSPSRSTLAPQIVQPSNKPVMRVAPMTAEIPKSPAVIQQQALKGIAAKTAITSTPAKPTFNVIDKKEIELKKEEIKKPPTPPPPPKPKVKTKFHLDHLEDTRTSNRKEKLTQILRLNRKRCGVRPVYGADLCDVVNAVRDTNVTKPLNNTWKGLGYVNCLHAHACEVSEHIRMWKETSALRNLILTPETRLTDMLDILTRYAFVTPPVAAPRIQMHVSHPSPSWLRDDRLREFVIHREVAPKAELLHPIASRTTVQFPEVRLIEYDCGKLQTLNVLLRDLKTGGHRTLIFTQMTKMLDVLEAFLSYHGHRYLRLDGTTRVDQRQFLMDRFNADKRIFCFILSTRSGGIGVNLTGADTVIFYDSDWNPTMDAQAQDRCHRIGQTRDVHIYRLISERTIEENILKKANQKRLLGDMAIEGGNFTTAFFKSKTLSDLFAEPSGLKTLADEKEKQAERESTVSPVPGKEGKVSQAELEQALCGAEDDLDVQAAKTAKAEQSAELAEFDETIPWDEREENQIESESKLEKELAMLDKELTAVERYAVSFLERQLDPIVAEELQQAEEDIQNAKKDWELSRLKQLKEEEERRAEIEEDEMYYTYSSGSSKKVKKKPKKRLSKGKNKGFDSSDDESYTPTKRRSLPNRSPKKTPPPPTARVGALRALPSRSPPDAVKKTKIITPKIVRINPEIKSAKKATPVQPSQRFGIESLNVISPKPFANPHLVIRTRKATTTSGAVQPDLSPIVLSNIQNPLKDNPLRDAPLKDFRNRQVSECSEIDVESLINDKKVNDNVVLAPVNSIKVKDIG